MLDEPRHPDQPLQPDDRPSRWIIKHPWFWALAALSLVMGGLGYHVGNPFTQRAANRREANVRHLLRDATVRNLALEPGSFAALPGPVGRFFLRRRLVALTRIFMDDPRKKTVPQVIDACRREPYGVPATILLARAVPIADLGTSLGTPSARSRNRLRLGRMGMIEFLTFGHLDVGIKGEAIVAVRIH